MNLKFMGLLVIQIGERVMYLRVVSRDGCCAGRGRGGSAWTRRRRCGWFITSGSSSTPAASLETLGVV